MTLVHPSAAIVQTAPICDTRRDNRAKIASLLDVRSRVLEGFAGTGCATKVWAETAGLVTAIEKDPATYEELQQTVGQRENVHATRGDAKELIPIYSIINRRYDVVDLDDNGNFLDLIPESFNLLREGGFLSITCTAYMNIMRNLNEETLAQRYGEKIRELYKREEVRNNREQNRRKLSRIVSETVEQEGLRRGYKVETLCTEIGVHALSKIFAVNNESAEPYMLGLTREAYKGPTN